MSEGREEVSSDLTANGGRSGKSAAATGGQFITLIKLVVLMAGVCVGLLYLTERIAAQRSDGRDGAGRAQAGFDAQISGNAQRMMEEGKQIFRFDTFGDEVFWTDTLKLHRAIEGSKFGGVGPGVSPKTALAVGLKVDMDALPADLVEKVKRGEVNLDDPATTLALLKLNSVVGVKATFNGDGSLKTVGLSCAVCHSTVDDAFAPGIGHRLDGWPNRDLNSGMIISLAPDLSVFTKLLQVDEATVKKVLGSWGPGKFDAELNLDGKAFRPDGKPAATLIPPAFGLAGVNLHTWTGGWGTVTYWNAFVGNLELSGQGTFFDQRLNDPKKYPVATRAGFFNKRSPNDMVTAKLG
nr:hypothetical protein [Acidobacteriota bacterium]